MLIYINSFLQVLTITIGTFMIERYVLLEPALEEKKQKIFYLICFCCVLITFIFLSNYAQYVSLLFGILNIFLARKKHRILGAISVIPLIGIINGIASPIFIVDYALETYLKLDTESIALQLAILGIYIIFAVFLVIFYFKGKNWRKWFNENMKDRSPSITERIVIFISGVVITIFSTYINIVSAKYESLSDEAIHITTTISIFFEIIAFMTTIIIIIMIMQGNKRKFYNDRVSNMQFSVIATMADIVEDRDSNTGGHIKRTAKYVEIIGKYLLKRNEFPDILTKQYLEDMVVAAPLHDIGKISVPDAILNKPGRLTPEEFDIMKKHSSAGREVLAKAEQQMGKFDYLDIAMDMAESHHEWFNGKGYPKGITGNDIPLCARIMAVADVFDALTSKRCYKDAMPLDKAYSIIEEESGTHFDPIIAEAFLNSKAEIEEAMQMLAGD